MVLSRNVIRLSAVAGLVCIGAAVAHGAVLTDDPTIRAAGTYTYYARGNASEQAITPFTTRFYPGPNLHAATSGQTAFLDGSRQDTGSNAAPIGFANGELTDNNTTNEVAGWIDVLQPLAVSTSVRGTFDIVIDLGSVCTVNSIAVLYKDQGGYRWTTTADVHKAYYATQFTEGVTTDGDLTLFDSGSTTGDTTGTLTFTPASPVAARYLVLRLDTTVSLSPPATNTGSQGGKLREIMIDGVVPEPSTMGVLGLGAAALWARGRGHRDGSAANSARSGLRIIPALKARRCPA